MPGHSFGSRVDGRSLLRAPRRRVVGWRQEREATALYGCLCGRVVLACGHEAGAEIFPEKVLGKLRACAECA